MSELTIDRRTFLRGAGAIGVTLALPISLEGIALATTKRDFQVDLSRTFVPEYIAQSTHASKYFLRKPRKRLESLGLFYDFDDKKLKLFDSLSSKPFDPIDTTRTIKLWYTTRRTLRDIDRIKGKATLTEEDKKKREKLEQKISNVRAIQGRLQAEGFFKGDVDGLFDPGLKKAMKKYQRSHGLHVDGEIGSKTLRELNQPYLEHAQGEINNYKGFFGDRLFHQTYVLDEVNLARLVDSSFAQIGLSSPSDVLTFNGRNPRNVKVSLEIPDNYLVREMTLGGVVTRHKKHKHKGTFRLYQYLMELEEPILLLETKMALGGKHMDHSTGQEREFPTRSGRYFWKRIVVMPSWHPPGWAEEGKGHESTKPGPLNAYGMYMTEYYRNDRQFSDDKRDSPGGYRFKYRGDAGFRAHSTNSPNSIRWGGSSHGCTRIHPTVANRLFPFILHNTMHHPMRYNKARGDIIPFLKNRAIKVTIHP
jgi:hypothetical protein